MPWITALMQPASAEDAVTSFIPQPAGYTSLRTQDASATTYRIECPGGAEYGFELPMAMDYTAAGDQVTVGFVDTEWVISRAITCSVERFFYAGVTGAVGVVVGVAVAVMGAVL